MQTMQTRAAVENSPIHRAVWDRRVDLSGFDSRPLGMSARVQAVADESVRIVRRHQDRGTLYGADGCLSRPAQRDLAAAGYFGVAAGVEFGGAGGSFADTAALVAVMSEADPYVAGLMSTQACLGPIGVLQAFGTKDQKVRLLGPLARGERLGAFAVTEPVSSSDWNLLQTVARRDGDSLVLTGEKFLITNAAPGRTVSVLCRVDGRFELVAVELPDEENDHFEVVRYGIAAPAHVPNAGLRFKGLRVPAANIIPSPGADGRALAYYALNRGRVAICGFSAGVLRRMGAELIPWVRARSTYGAPVGSRELVRYRLGRLAGRIVGCDALLAWTSQLLDQGAHGQLECITAKTLAGEWVKEALTDLFLKTQGGRAFLDGNFFTAIAFDALAPPVYEGESELLGLVFYRALARAHARMLGDLSRTVRSARKEWTLDAAATVGTRAIDYLTWAVGRRLQVPSRDRTPSSQAAVALQRTGAEISSALRRDAEGAFLRQADMLEAAQRTQAAAATLVISRYAGSLREPTVQRAAGAMAAELACRLSGARMPSDVRQQFVDAGAAVADGRFPLISQDAVSRAPIPRMMDRLENVLTPAPLRPREEPQPRPEAQLH